MVYVPVRCPYCQSPEVSKAGKQANGTQRYRCQNGQCEQRIFLLRYQDRGRHPKSAARWSIWRSMAVASAIPPACCGSVPRPSSLCYKKAPTLQHANLAVVPHLVHAAAPSVSN